jgi:uncharacterized glyoxalase superfamily protein PhnB
LASGPRASDDDLVDPSDRFYGYRDGRLEDPFGHLWMVSQKIEELSPEEMQRRMA